MRRNTKTFLAIAAAACLCAPVMAQPGFVPGGRGGPGGGPSPSFGRGPGSGPGGPSPFMSGGPGMSSGAGAPPSYRSPSPGGPSPYSHGGESVPSTRFGSIPSQYSPMGPGMGPDAVSGPGIGAGRPMTPAAPPDTSRAQQALRQGDYATIGKESAGIRNRTERIDRMGPDLPVQDRIQLPLINHMYKQGADLMEEGRSTRNDAKIRMGIQQINQANEKLDRLKRDRPEQGKSRR